MNLYTIASQYTVTTVGGGNKCVRLKNKGGAWNCHTLPLLCAVSFCKAAFFDWRTFYLINTIFLVMCVFPVSNR